MQDLKKNYKILLIKPNIMVRKGFVLQSKMSPPVGLAYIAASLVNEGYEVKIIDMVAEDPDSSWDYHDTHVCHGLSDDNLIKRVHAFSPDIIGIGGFTSQFSRINQIVFTIKKNFPDIFVVLGGVNATAQPKFVMDKSKADFIVLGEGEETIVEIVKAIQLKQIEQLKNIDGIAYKQDNNIRINAKTKFINNIDSIAWPARNLLNHEKYIADGVTMPVITSRSCPGRCAFCCVHLMTGKKWRPRNPYDVVDEIEELVTRWSYKNVSIFDDASNVDPERLITICKEVVRRKLNIKLSFPSSVIVRFITKDLLYWMKQAGSIGLSIPIEHANENMRNKIMKKGVSLEQVERVLDWCREIKLLTFANFVVGMPGETEETLKELVDYVKKMARKLDGVSAYLATPFPGTSFYDDCLKNQYIKNPEKNDFLDFDTYTVHIQTKFLSKELLLHYKQVIEQSFLDTRGDEFPASYIRKIFRKPTSKDIDYLENVYFDQNKI
jgi:magnesium-protoporphyrin IX monomethyl ester (oxidative) cyclase